jgi:clan AA aspartic protease
MGITYVHAHIINPRNPKQLVEERFLVDSGASFSVVHQTKLQEIGVKPNRTLTFVLADGRETKRPVGDIIIRYKDIQAATPVVFGEKSDSTLLGVLTLEALGLILDPFKRTLHHAKLFLG